MLDEPTSAGCGDSRHAFVQTSLASGFAAPVSPVTAQTSITTDSTGLLAGEVRIPANGGDMPGYRAAPAAGPGDRSAAGPTLPIIIVVQEIFGVHEHIKDVCRRFAKLGYLAVAPELYARQGDPSHFTDIPTLYAAIVSKVPDAQVMADLDATAAWAAANGGDKSRLGITGFCWGGRITWLYAAHNPAVKAGVAWYGRLVGDSTALTPVHPVDIAPRLLAPVLGLYGGADSGIPTETIERMKRALAVNAGAGGRSRFVVYPDAPHAFHADYRPSYRKQAAQDGWTRCVAWLKENGVG